MFADDTVRPKTRSAALTQAESMDPAPEVGAPLPLGAACQVYDPFDGGLDLHEVDEDYVQPPKDRHAGFDHR